MGPVWEGGLTSLPQPERAELRPPASPNPAAPEDRLVSPSSQPATASAAPRDRLVSPSSQEDLLCADNTATPNSQFSILNSQLENNSQLSTPSAIRTLSEAEYYALLLDFLPDEPASTAPDHPAQPLSAPDTLPSFYQPTLRDYLGNLARRIVCDRMPYLCSAD